jgi:glycosyltransferase involved in cell wall biosynthesis
MEKLSVVVICFNEEKNIQRCLDSVKDVADEIVVLDSNSTDRTVALAKEMGAIVKQDLFRGYIQQVNNAIALASNNYVLSLDADEALDPVLSASVLREKENFTGRAYRMNRCCNYCGQFIRHGSWYPDSKIRLFDKRIATAGGLDPHPKIVLTEMLPVQNLPGDILHYSYNSVSEHVAQNNRFSTLAAEAHFRTGKKTSILNIIVRPGWAFFLSYILRMGFRDGLNGFVIAIQIAQLTFLKHLKLYQLNKSVK